MQGQIDHLNAKVSENYDQEIGNFIVDEKGLGETDLVDRLDLVREKGLGLKKL